MICPLLLPASPGRFRSVRRSASPPRSGRSAGRSGSAAAAPVLSRQERPGTIVLEHVVTLQGRVFANCPAVRRRGESPCPFPLCLSQSWLRCFLLDLSWKKWICNCKILFLVRSVHLHFSALPSKNWRSSWGRPTRRSRSNEGEGERRGECPALFLFPFLLLGLACSYSTSDCTLFSSRLFWNF